VNINRNSSTVIGDAHAAISKKNDIYFGAITSKSFVDCVIDDFINQVVEAAFAGRSDIHTGALADRLEAFEDGDCAGVIGPRNLLLSH
jgi:hypothetical protein